jgi:hypothetical protein
LQLKILSLLICGCGALGNFFEPPTQHLLLPKPSNAISASSMFYNSFAPPAPFIGLARPNFVLPTPFYLPPRRPVFRIPKSAMPKNQLHYIPLESAPPATPFPDFETSENHHSNLSPPEVVSELPGVPPPPPPPHPPALPKPVYNPPAAVYSAPLTGEDVFLNAGSAGKMSFSLVSVVPGFENYVSTTAISQVIVPALEYGL